MSLNKAMIFGCNHVVKEYLLLLRDDTVRVLLDEVSLRSIGNKTSCVVELTKRVLNRRVGGLRVVKYVIVRIVGEDDAAVRVCNRLLESRLPSYRQRREYVRRAECCTIYPGEMAPDNTALYFSFQRSGPASCHYGDVLVKSPYEPSLRRPCQDSCWKTSDVDLTRGIMIAERKQLERYLDYRLSRAAAAEGLRKNKCQDAYFDPKAPIRYMYDDYEDMENNSNYPCRKIVKKVSRFNDYPCKKDEYIKSINVTNVTSPLENCCVIRKIPKLKSRPKKNKHYLEENKTIENLGDTVKFDIDKSVIKTIGSKISLNLEAEFLNKFNTTELNKVIEKNSKNISVIYNKIEGKNITEIVKENVGEVLDKANIKKKIQNPKEIQNPKQIKNSKEIQNPKEIQKSTTTSKEVIKIDINVQSLPLKDDDKNVLLLASIDKIMLNIIYGLYDEKSNECINKNMEVFKKTFPPIENNIIDFCIIKISEDIITMMKKKATNSRRVSLTNTKQNLIKENDDSCSNNCLIIIKIKKDVFKWIINEEINNIIQNMKSSDCQVSKKGCQKYKEVIKIKSTMSNEKSSESLEITISNSILDNILEDSVVTFVKTPVKDYDVEFTNLTTISDSPKNISSSLQSRVGKPHCMNKRSDSTILSKNDYSKSNSDKSLISHMINNIISVTIEEIFDETFSKCKRSSNEKVYFSEAIKNPSARLIDIRHIIEKSPLKKEMKIPKALATKVHTSAIMQKPPETVTFNKTRQHCLMHHQESTLNIKNENPEVKDVMIPNVVYSGNEKSESKSKSNSLSTDLKYNRTLEKCAKKVSYPKSTSSVVHESQNTLNTKSSRKKDEHQIIKTECEKAKTKGNCHVINVELDNDVKYKTSDFKQSDDGVYRLDIYKVIDNDKQIETSKPTHVIEIGSRYSDIVEIEDSLEILLESKGSASPLKINHEINLNTIENQSLPEILYETIEKAFLVGFQFAQEDSKKFEQVVLTSEFILPTTCYNPTTEEWRIDKLKTPIIHLSISPVNITPSKETFGKTCCLPEAPNDAGSNIKFSDVLRSQFTIPERTNINSGCNLKSTPEFYTTVSIDNDLEGYNYCVDSEMRCNHRDINTQLTTIEDVLSSMTNDYEEEDEDYCKYKNFVVEREKVILIMKSNCGSPTNIIKVQQLKNSSMHDNADSNPECSECETSFTEVIKSILHNTSNDSKYRAPNIKTTSFTADNNNSFIDIIASQRNTSQATHCKRPSVKKTLLDLSKEVKCKRRHKLMTVVDEEEEYKDAKNNEKDENENFIEKSVNECNNNDFSNKSQSIEASNGSFTMFSNIDSAKIKLKPRSRSLSDKIKFVAKQFISKFNILNKKSLKDKNINDTSAASHKSCILTELSSKSSIDSKLSKNSLARYWNIHRFDSVKRMKVKGYVIIPPSSQQTISG